MHDKQNHVVTGTCLPSRIAPIHSGDDGFLCGDSLRISPGNLTYPKQQAKLKALTNPWAIPGETLQAHSGIPGAMWAPPCSASRPWGTR